MVGKVAYSYGNDGSAVVATFGLPVSIIATLTHVFEIAVLKVTIFKLFFG